MARKSFDNENLRVGSIVDAIGDEFYGLRRIVTFWGSGHFAAVCEIADLSQKPAELVNVPCSKLLRVRY